MRVYVQGRHGIPGSVSSYDAYLGFCDMGFEVVVFDDPQDLRNATKEDLVVGGIGIVRPHLEGLGANCPDIDYPEELNRFLCRKLWRTTIDRVNCGLIHGPFSLNPLRRNVSRDASYAQRPILSGKDAGEIATRSFAASPSTCFPNTDALCEGTKSLMYGTTEAIGP